MLKTSSLRQHLIATAVVACLGAGAAFAQTTTPPTAADRQARMQEHRAHMLERMNQRFAELKAKLAITPGQEAAWNTWVAAMKPSAAARPAPADLSTLTTPQRIDRLRALRAERQGAMDKRADATLAFYATLTAQQKQVFDAETAKLFQHHGRGGPGRHGHHGG